MTGTKLAGGPTQDEIMAVSLFKLGLRSTDTVLEIGCGTGKVSIAAAHQAKKIISLDKRPEAIMTAQASAQKSDIHNIEFLCTDAVDYLTSDRIFDCAFVGGTQHLNLILPVLAKKVTRTIVINAVLLSTLEEAVATMKQLGIFYEVVQVQVARSHEIAGSLMFKPIDPVYVIVGKGTAC
ncbi:MAG: methyltransferase domain-containing protein [Methanoregula sp.]|jgi:cobalt-precorrin-6B (C15)-methyltransferase|nr:methyltransferase domain-containing protein [Methanoregula sp.]